MNPVTLVSTVVARKTAVHLGSRLEPNIATSTTMPAAMPIRLKIVCTTVNVGSDIPRSIADLLSRPGCTEMASARGIEGGETKSGIRDGAGQERGHERRPSLRSPVPAPRQAGLMFWLIRKRLPGSTAFLIAASRG